MVDGTDAYPVLWLYLARLTALLHHVTVQLLEDLRIKENADPGVDGITWGEYEVELERKLEDLAHV
jgi:hypothetical protein